MKCERIFLNEEKTVWIDTYLWEHSEELQPKRKRKAVLVCPGGGYQYTSDREAEPMALTFAAMGHHAFVLRYSVDLNAVMPRPIREAAQAVAYIKDHAKEWYLDENQVYLVGFSAGGHLAAALGVFWNDRDMLPEYEGCRERIRPAGLILGYPVIDLKSTSTKLDIGIPDNTPLEEINFGAKHPAIAPEDLFVTEGEKRFVNFEVAMNAYMFGGYATKEQIDRYSLQNHVTEHTPKAFIWHGGQDGLIFPRNSMLFAKALMEHCVPVELHIFGQGGHGLGLANDVTANWQWEKVPAASAWVKMAETWLASGETV